MNALASHLERLGLDRYLDAFIGEGFDTWETLLDIQESDLESLNVKLGHRRKLQRAIAEYRGISYERLVGSPVGEGSSERGKQAENSSTQSSSRDNSSTAAPAETKRKYRRHPKPDENAPEKPPSAYVLFSNQVREEVKSENLSFTEIAKLVGDRWQKLDASQKGPFETHANALKDCYNVQASAYKKTEAYREYAQYLEDFKAKHGPHTEAKRPKLGAQSSTGSASVASAASQEILDIAPVGSSHMRVESIGSISSTSLTSALTSPATVSLGSIASLPNISASVPKTASLLPRPGSPNGSQASRDRRLLGQTSNQSSMSDDSGPSRSDAYDPLPRAAALSLSTPPASTPPLASHGAASGRPEYGQAAESHPWPSRYSLAPQNSPLSPSTHSALALPSSATSIETRRERNPEAYRQSMNLGLSHSGGYTAPFPSGPDRLSEAPRAPLQWTLPPLRQPQVTPSQFGTQPGPLGLNAPPFAPGPGGQSLYEPLPRSAHENEAANALARLSNRYERNNQPPPDDRKRQ